MPSADDKVHQFPMKDSVFNKMMGVNQPTSRPDDISLLREEIAELRRLMTPSIILTGQRCIDEYWKLTKPKR